MGVCLERSPHHVIALVGILKAGGVYVPLDPEAPVERIRYVLQDTQMALVLTQRAAAGQGERCGRGGGEPGPRLGSDRAAGRRGAGRAAGEEQLAYVLYTSGSTGQPKGVMVERGAISAHTAGDDRGRTGWVRRIEYCSSVSTPPTRHWSRSWPPWRRAGG